MLRFTLKRITVLTLIAGTCALWVSSPAHAQNLVAYDDEFYVPLGQPLTIESFGVLDNDILDGEAAGEFSATAELVSDASFGTLTLAADGSFTYDVGPGFDGHDSFVYRAVFDAVTSEATVVLSACDGGPDVYACWSESEFLAKAAELGLNGFTEGFEDEAVWGAGRSPFEVDAVVSQGIRWTSNHTYGPVYNQITTGSGPARTGLWGFFDLAHGYATGSAAACDVDTPAVHCLYHDGWTGAREPGESALHGVGGYVTGTYGANVAVSLDGGVPLGGGRVYAGHQFLGVIDARPAGFTTFRFEETDGKVGQALYIWADDFTFLTAAPSSVGEPGATGTRVFFAGAGPNPSGGATALHFTLTAAAEVHLEIYDQRGRLVRRLARTHLEAGRHAVDWDGRDHAGRAVASSTYFGRLTVSGGGMRETQVRKILVRR